MDIEENIRQGLNAALRKLGIDVRDGDIAIERSRQPDHGDYASNIAMRLASRLHQPPLRIADSLISAFAAPGVEKAEKAGPGFINFYLRKSSVEGVVSLILAEGSSFGCSDHGKNEKTLLEYVSANPTGALHLGHARGAAIGDSLSRILKKCGYDITREYYVNDAGNQIDNLARSLRARYLQACGQAAEVPAEGYHGADIVAFGERLYQEGKDKYISESLAFFKARGIAMALENIKKDLKDFRVEFDVFSSEQAIRDQGKVEEVIKLLKPHCYDKDGAVFLKTTPDGDDKDRVIVKSDGSYTYLLPDIAYHKYKFDRGYVWLIDLLGADHHGYIARLKSSMKSLGYNPDKLDVDLVQMVRLFKDGQEYKMSKRTGNAISLRELCEEVGVDAVRFFFVSRANSQHLDFNLDLAKTMGNANPVYYCQYAHARLSAILEMAEGKYIPDKSGAGLESPSEQELMKKLAAFPAAVLDAGLTLSPYKITIYVRGLASDINDFYTKCRVLDPDNERLTSARLGLCEAARTVLAEGLRLIGVSAPDHM